MGPRALIDLAALRHNLQRARAAAPQSDAIAVVKANAYGHGVLPIARTLAPLAQMLAVARVEEGVVLREAGIEAPLLVLEGSFDAEELRAASAHRLQLAVHQPEQLALLEETRLATPVHCWLKVDTGMHRVGFAPEQAARLLEQLRRCRNVSAPTRLMSHLANADDLQDDRTEQQLCRFLPLLDAAPEGASLANSAGVLGWPDTHLQWIRPGIMLYGASPLLGRDGPADGLRPVMTLGSRLIAVNRYHAGAAIGYGGSWRCPEAMPVGVVAAGYGDGYPRHAPSGTPVLVNGRRVPLIGRVSMDMLTVDLRSQPEARSGDPVVLWGDGLPVEAIADAAGTISYELFCGVTARVCFEYRGEVDRGEG